MIIAWLQQNKTVQRSKIKKRGVPFARILTWKTSLIKLPWELSVQCYKALGGALKSQLVESFLFNTTTGSRDRTGGYQPWLDWEPQCWEQLRETLWTMPPRLTKGCGCRCTFRCWTSCHCHLDCERGNDAATGPNCSFDFIKLQWKPLHALILDRFFPLPSHRLFNHFVLTGCHSYKNKWPCLAIENLFSTML